jgi:hypothetical protein
MRAQIVSSGQRACGAQEYVVELDGTTYGVIDWKDLPTPIVYDIDMVNHIKPYRWYFDTNVYYSGHRNMQNLVWDVKGTAEVTANQKLIQINGVRTDNRVANLKLANKSEVAQRGQRSDRKPPPADVVAVLQAIDNTDSLPRFVRWADSLQRFEIEDHPALRQKVRDGSLKKARWQGSKSAKLTIKDKYMEMKGVLDTLNATDPETAATAQRLSREFMAIQQAVRAHSI